MEIEKPSLLGTHSLEDKVNNHNFLHGYTTAKERTGHRQPEADNKTY